MDFSNIEYLVVGAGLFGSVIAERIANVLNKQVTVIERRNHIGGNCYSEYDHETGIEYHKYGTHIFHTSNQEVWDYINTFCEFNGYYHQVLTTYKGKVYQMPINLETINSYYNTNLKPYEVDLFLNNVINKEKNLDLSTFEGKTISLIGRELYNAFIKGYSIKQWHKDPKLLPASIIQRLPFRKNYNESYYFSRWQGIPLNGYTDIFNKMLYNKNIEVFTDVDFFNIKLDIPKDTTIIYTGPIDKFFNYKYGKLDWLTLRFEKKIVNFDDFQGTSVMNYSDIDIPYTRIHEPKHLHPERHYNEEKTVIIKEYSIKDGGQNPYYPIKDAKNLNLYRQYQQEGERLKNTYISGRLGQYKYLDMDGTIEAALKLFSDKINNNK